MRKRKRSQSSPCPKRKSTWTLSRNSPALNSLTFYARKATFKPLCNFISGLQRKPGTCKKRKPRKVKPYPAVKFVPGIPFFFAKRLIHLCGRRKHSPFKNFLLFCRRTVRRTCRRTFRHNFLNRIPKQGRRCRICKCRQRHKGQNKSQQKNAAIAKIFFLHTY